MLRGNALRFTAAPLSMVLLLGACYRYVPAPGGDFDLGAVYRGHLTPDGTERVAPRLGSDVGFFDGRVVTATDTSLLVAMNATMKRSDPRRTLWSGEQLSIPRSAVLTFERREMDRRKTVGALLLSAAGILATGALWLSIKGRVSGSPGGGPDPIPY